MYTAFEMRRLGLLLCAVAAGVLVPAGPAAATAQTFVATLVGSQEVGPTGSPATGSGTVALNAAETQITVTANFVNLLAPSTAGHIHANVAPAPAPPGTIAPVRFDFGAGWTGAPNGSIGPLVFGVTPAQVLQLRKGQMYFNIHSGVFPGGEIRGQIVTSASQPAVVSTSTTWNLRNALTTGPASNIFAYGTRPNVPFMCDLNGDGDETPVSYEAGSFKVRHSNSPGDPDTTIPHGDPRGFPVGGDFDGDALDDLAVYRNGTWQVRYTDDGAIDTFSFGPGGNWPSTVPVSGDWDGNGVDGIGTYTYSTATWNLRHTATTGPADAGAFLYGTGNTTYPVVGDWDMDNDETVGVTQGQTWSLRNVNNAGAPNIAFDFLAPVGLPLSWRGAAVPPGP